MEEDIDHSLQNRMKDVIYHLFDQMRQNYQLKEPGHHQLITFTFVAVQLSRANIINHKMVIFCLNLKLGIPC